MALNLHSMTHDFPPMDTAEYAALRDDIARHGIVSPLLVWRGTVVDGRHRLTAAIELGLPADRIPIRRLADDMPESAVIGLMVAANVQRRHLNATQRAMIAARVERRRHGVTTGDTPTRAQRAGMFGVSVSLVRRADALTDTAPPELVAAVAAGEKTMRDAEAELAAAAQPARPAAVDALEKVTIPAAGRMITAMEQAIAAAAAELDDATRREIIDAVKSINPVVVRMVELLKESERQDRPPAPPAPPQSKPPARGKTRNPLKRGKRGK